MEKPKRNEICSCGSNKKFKKCCEPVLKIKAAERIKKNNAFWEAKILEQKQSQDFVLNKLTALLSAGSNSRLE